MVTNMTGVPIRSASSTKAPTLDDVTLLYGLSKELTSTLDGDEVQRAVLRWAKDGVMGEIAGLLLPTDPPAQRSWKLLVSASGIDASGATGQIRERLLNGMHAVSDQLDLVSEIQTVFDGKAVTELGITDLDASELKSFLSVPLIVGAEAIGMLGVGSVIPQAFDSRHLGLLSTIANQAAVAINNTKLFRQTLLEKQQLETVLTNMADGLLMLDEHGRVATINPALERMLGVEEKEILGRRPSEASSDPRLVPLASLCAGLGREITLEEERVVRASSSVMTNAAKRYMGAVVVVHDVTRERELDQMKSDFLANASHELRTPLHSIKGFIKLLLDDNGPDPETRKEFLGIIKEQSEHLGSLVDDLLHVSRIDAGHLELRQERLLVDNLIHKTAQKLSNMASDEGIEFKIDVPSPLTAIEGDEDRLMQVLTNLLHNAIKFSPDGGEVTVRARVNDRELLVQVADRGIGIPEEAIPRLFDRFYQVDGSMTRSAGGSGLGLYISKQIVEAHGGRIWADSIVGEGTAFSFTVPLETCPDGTTNGQP
ncbi:MAG: ATP-binding protein [Chloroflexi bacterium]|nr:ATP-binding protein [Chloroflexota bacterium]